MRAVRSLIGGTLFVFLLLANPAWFISCVSNESEGEFSFGQEEMEALLDDMNGQTWTADGYRIELELRREETQLARTPMAGPSFVSSAKACESRSFVASAAACIDESYMYVTGTLRIFTADDEGELLEEFTVVGEYSVTGLDLDNAMVELDFANNGKMGLAWQDVGEDADESPYLFRYLQVSDLGDDDVDIDYHYR
jgi:hypothetical protein